MLSLFLIEAIFKIRRLEVRPPVTRRVLRLRVEVAERKRAEATRTRATTRLEPAAARHAGHCETVEVDAWEAG